MATGKNTRMLLNSGAKTGSEATASPSHTELRNTTYELALAITEQLHERLREQPFECHGRESYPVTISIGIATTLGDEPVNPVELLDRADKNLYAAKQFARCGVGSAETLQ
jgi:diguanylate cyclase (GGDEF)-like protein